MCLCSGQLSSGTKDAYLRGRRRFKGGLTSLARKPQLPISGPSGTGFAVSDPWHTLQAGSCAHTLLIKLSLINSAPQKRSHGHMHKRSICPHASMHPCTHVPWASPGPTVPHRSERLGVGRSIRRLAVPRHAISRPRNLESLPSSRICMAGAK